MKQKEPKQIPSAEKIQSDLNTACGCLQFFSVCIMVTYDEINYRKQYMSINSDVISCNPNNEKYQACYSNIHGINQQFVLSNMIGKTVRKRSNE